MRRIEQPEILSVLKGGWKEKDVQGIGKIFQRVVHVGGRLGIFTNNYMIELATRIMLINSTYYKGRRTTVQVLTKNLLGLGKSEPVRQLKKAGVIFIRVEQHLQIHISGAKIGKVDELIS
jgi:hypothetical protein